jgi:hypothetical protein
MDTADLVDQFVPDGEHRGLPHLPTMPRILNVDEVMQLVNAAGNRRDRALIPLEMARSYCDST